MNNKNKNIKRDILQLVSNRLKNKNQTLHYLKTSCQSCICTKISPEKIGQQTEKTNHLRIQVNKQRQLSIIKNLYQIQILPYPQDKINQCSPSPHKLIKINSKKSEQFQQSQHDTMKKKYSQEETQNMIKQWVLYSLQFIEGNLFQQNKKSINLPMQSCQDLKKLKNRIDSASDFKVFHSRNSLMGQSQQLGSNFFKKQIKFPQINESPQKNSSQIKQLDISSIKRKVSSLNSKNSSLKLLQSTSTIPSQKLLDRNKYQTSSQDLMRMLFIQADSIERVIKHE